MFVAQHNFYEKEKDCRNQQQKEKEILRLSCRIQFCLTRIEKMRRKKDQRSKRKKEKNAEEKDEEDDEESGSESSDDNSEEARIQQQKETDEAAHTLVHEVGK